jgi:hypothetical protein
MLQRLPQPPLQLRSVGPTDSRPASVLQHHFELPVRNGFEPQNAFDVDDGRPVHPNEAHGVQFFAEVMQRGTAQELLAADVQIDLDPGSLDPVDIHDSHEPSRPSGLHHQSVQGTRSSGRHRREV